MKNFFIINKNSFLLSLWKFYIFFAVFGSLLNNFCEVLGLPNVFTLSRFLSLIGILLITENKVYRKTPLHLYTYIFFILFLASYLGVAVFQSQLSKGLYFIRLYIEPLLIAYSAYFIFSEKTYTKQIIAFIQKLVLVSVAVSLVSVVMFYTNRKITMLFHGNNTISALWLLGGSVIYRAGFPIGGPNQLGLFYAVTLILLLNFKHSNNLKQTVLIFAASFGLTLSFSKSGIASFLVFFFFYTLVLKPNFKVIISFVSVVLIFGVILYFLDEIIFKGMFSKYINGLTSSEDVSTMGHMNSLKESFHNLKEYYAWGYTKGTVGPRAKLFTAAYKNDESSLFILLFDMGFVGGFIYLMNYILLLSKALKNLHQVAYLTALIIPYFFLPMIHSVEVTSIVVLYYCIIGGAETKLAIKELK